MSGFCNEKICQTNLPLLLSSLSFFTTPVVVRYFWYLIQATIGWKIFLHWHVFVCTGLKLSLLNKISYLLKNLLFLCRAVLRFLMWVQSCVGNYEEIVYFKVAVFDEETVCVSMRVCEERERRKGVSATQCPAADYGSSVHSVVLHPLPETLTCELFW